MRSSDFNAEYYLPMDRPLSSASTTTVRSGASDLAHKRNTSIATHGKRTATSYTVSLFVGNLRALNLDLLPDWPNITPISFGNQDARTRSKCTEYALFQLFRLYDPATTAEKLQPFFPPLEPLQSVNLRAALFRCLNELKKNGLLSKDVVLRKSMLDDCQGEKFWELCLNFSMLVLRKALPQKKSKHSRPVVQQICAAHAISTVQRESMLPLAIAHKSALSRALDDKRKKRETYVRLHALMSEKGDELRQRKVKSQEATQQTATLSPTRLRSIEQAVQSSWIGSHDLKDALINGDTCASGDGVLVDSFEHLWEQGGDKELIVSNGAEVGLLQNLSSKATQQSVRLSMWQSYLDRLVNTRKGATVKAPPKPDESSDRPHFDQHRALNLKRAPPPADDLVVRKPSHYRNASRYDEILTAMREELRKNSAGQKSADTSQHMAPVLKRAQTQPSPSRIRTVEADTSAGARDLHSRTPSQTAVPIGTRFKRRVPSQTKAYEKPKIDGQREPIQLKSELFSPLKENRRSQTSLASFASGLPSPVEETGFDDATESRATTETGRSSLVSDDGKISDVPYNDTDVPGLSEDGNTIRDSVTGNSIFRIPASPNTKPVSPPSTVRPSLAERTRMSIAFNSSEDVTGFLPELPLNATLRVESQVDESPTTRTAKAHDKHSSLLDRTRESILMAPQDAVLKSKRSSHARTRSSIHPVNQFDTPQKSRRISLSATADRNNGQHETLVKRVITPLDTLLSPEAEYDSVFKPRPRVAHSPVLSPRIVMDEILDSAKGGSDGENELL